MEEQERERGRSIRQQLACEEERGRSRGCNRLSGRRRSRSRSIGRCRCRSRSRSRIRSRRGDLLRSLLLKNITFLINITQEEHVFGKLILL